MWEVTVIDNQDSIEIGTFDYDRSLIFVGSVIDDRIVIRSVELNPITGEDAKIVVEFI